jgi:hypothetical protein
MLKAFSGFLQMQLSAFRTTCFPNFFKSNTLDLPNLSGDLRVNTTRFFFAFPNSFEPKVKEREISGDKGGVNCGDSCFFAIEALDFGKRQMC